MPTWKSKVAVGLMWLSALPSFLMIVPNIKALLTPGYEMGEQFAPIWIMMFVLVLAVLIFVSHELLKKQRKITYIIVTFVLGLSFFSDVVELFLYRDLLSSVEPLQGTIIIIRVLLEGVVFVLLLLDKETYLKIKSGPSTPQKI